MTGHAALIQLNKLDYYMVGQTASMIVKRKCSVPLAHRTVPLVVDHLEAVAGG